MVLALLVAVVVPVTAAAQPAGSPSPSHRVDLAVTPSGDGAWVLAPDDDIAAVGDAAPHGAPAVPDGGPEATDDDLG
jgi:hypothetical protein